LAAAAAIARLRAREKDRRKDWVEKTSTDLARRFDVIRVEDLKITNMTQSARGTVEQPHGTAGEPQQAAVGRPSRQQASPRNARKSRSNGVVVN
jgi:transposase